MFEGFQPPCGPVRYSPDDREADVSGEATDLEWGTKALAEMADLTGKMGSWGETGVRKTRKRSFGTAESDGEKTKARSPQGSHEVKGRTFIPKEVEP